MKPILITCYVNPDLDGVAGALAYSEWLQKIGKEVTVGIFGEPHEEAKFVLDRFHFTYPQIIKDAGFYDEVILVDASDLIGLEGNIAPDKVIEIIDHRKINEADKFPKAQVQIELVGAAATLIAEKFMQNNVEISEKSATLLSSAIISNTLNFKGGVTTDRDRAAVEWLSHYRQMPADFWRELFSAKSNLAGPKLAERIEGDFAWFVLGGRRIGIAQIEMIGADELISERSNGILKSLDKMKTDLNLDLVFQNTIELEKGKNYIITADELTKIILTRILKVKFVGICAETESLIMRKQIVPLLKEELEKEYQGIIALFYRETDGLREFLVVKNAVTGNMSFVAGAQEDFDRTLVDTLKRETFEELGLRIADDIIQPTDIKQRFIFNSQKKERAGCHGSYQVFLINATNIKSAIVGTSELKEVQWLDQDAVLISLTFPDLREVFLQAIKNL